LGISPTSGVLTGTPSRVVTTSTYSITVSDSLPSSVTTSFNLVVLAPPISLTTSTPSKGLTQYTQITPDIGFQPIVATNLGYGGLNYSIYPSISSLGLTFNNSTGYISGTPILSTSSTRYYITVNDQNNQVSTGSFTLSVASSTPPAISAVVASNSIQFAVGDSVDTYPVTGAGGFLISGAGYSYTILPNFSVGGLTYDATGHLTGTPTSVIGPITYNVTVKDSIPQAATGTFQITLLEK
jgi:hypothetical protein